MDVLSELNKGFTVRHIRNVAGRFEFFLDVSQDADVALGWVGHVYFETSELERVLGIYLDCFVSNQTLDFLKCII